MATITIDRPEKRNALSDHVQQELAATFRRLADDDSIGMVVLTGAGDKAFAAGGDLVALSEIRSAEGARAMARSSRSVLDSIRFFPAPVVAGLNGDALGGGAELAMACDFRVAGPKARMAFVQGRQAITSAWGGGVDLVQLVGRATALRLLCSCEWVDHDRGLAIGLYDHCAMGDETVGDAVDAFVAPMLERAPQVLRTYKALAAAERRAASRSELESIELERFVENWIHDDHWRGLDAFLNRKDRR